MKILINTPNYKDPASGGVANHFFGLFPYWNESVKYNIVGRRGKLLSGLFWLPWDIVKFIFLLAFFHPDVVMLNPSLGETALKRDFLFLRLSRFFKFKTIVHFHGFNPAYAEKCNHKWIANNLNEAQLILVLAGRFKNILTTWGITTPICLTSTKVDDRLTNGFSLSQKSSEVKSILFLCRIERDKGIFLALDVFALLQQLYPELRFTVTGDGSDLETAKQYAVEKDIRNIVFTGKLSGKKLIDTFVSNDLYLFTSFHEGMPTSVLEAMAFGLPVFTSAVGGLVDFFENNKMGFMTDSFNAKYFVEAIVPYIEDDDLRKRVSQYNYNYAHQHFMASRVAKNIENLLRDL